MPPCRTRRVFAIARREVSRDWVSAAFRLRLRRHRPSPGGRPKPLALPRARHYWSPKVFGRRCTVLDASEPNVQVGAAPPHGSLFTGLDGRQPALGALKAFKSLTEAPAGFYTRCLLNLNSHNHNQHAGRPCFPLQSSSSVQRLPCTTIFRGSETMHHTTVRMRFIRMSRAHRCIGQRRPNRRAPVANRALDQRRG